MGSDFKILSWFSGFHFEMTSWNHRDAMVSQFNPLQLRKQRKSSKEGKERTQLLKFSQQFAAMGGGDLVRNHLINAE